MRGSSEWGALQGGLNRNFNTNVEDVTHPARSIQNFPRDGGSGRELNAAGTFGNPRRETDNRLQTAFEETQDSIDGLNEGRIFADAVTQLTSARDLIAQAQHSNVTSQRRTLVQQAIVKLRSSSVYGRKRVLRLNRTARPGNSRGRQSPTRAVQ